MKSSAYAHIGVVLVVVLVASPARAAAWDRTVPNTPRWTQVRAAAPSWAGSRYAPQVASVSDAIRQTYPAKVAAARAASGATGAALNAVDVAFPTVAIRSAEGFKYFKMLPLVGTAAGWISAGIGAYFLGRDLGTMIGNATTAPETSMGDTFRYEAGDGPYGSIILPAAEVGTPPAGPFNTPWYAYQTATHATFSATIGEWGGLPCLIWSFVTGAGGTGADSFSPGRKLVLTGQTVRIWQGQGNYPGDLYYPSKIAEFTPPALEPETFPQTVATGGRPSDEPETDGEGNPAPDPVPWLPPGLQPPGACQSFQEVQAPPEPGEDTIRIGPEGGVHWEPWNPGTDTGELSETSSSPAPSPSPSPSSSPSASPSPTPTPNPGRTPLPIPPGTPDNFIIHPLRVMQYKFPFDWFGDALKNVSETDLYWTSWQNVSYGGDSMEVRHDLNQLKPIFQAVVWLAMIGLGVLCLVML